jgi:prepilin-type N-terminal cleavage/methylation domain-containing protein
MSGSKKFLRDDSKGFSLIEVIIAVIILAILAVPLMRGFVITQKLNSRAGELEEYENLSQTIFEGSWNYSIEDIALMFNDPSLSSFIVPRSQFTSCKPLGNYYDEAGNFIGSASNIYEFAIDDFVVSSDTNKKYDVIVRYDASHYMGDESSSAARDASSYNYNAFEYSTAAIYDENVDYMFLMNEDDDEDAYEAIRVLLNDSTISDEELKKQVRREINITVKDSGLNIKGEQTSTVTANIKYYYPADADKNNPASVMTYAGGTYTQTSANEPYPRNIFICYYPDYYSDYSDRNLLDYIYVNNETNNKMSLVVAMQEPSGTGSSLTVNNVDDYWVHFVVNDPNCKAPSATSPNVTLRTNLGFNIIKLRDKGKNTSVDSCKDNNQAFLEYYYNSGTMNLNCWLADMDLMEVLPLDGSMVIGNVVYDTTVEFYEADTYDKFTENYSKTEEPLLSMTSDEEES